MNLANRDGETPLLVAIREKSTRTINQLLSKRADVNYENKNGENALHVAVRSGVREAVQIILGKCIQLAEGIRFRIVICTAGHNC